MPGRRRIETSAPLRSSLANAAFAVEERVVWGGADALRRAGEVAKWPFERIAWALERGLVWPLEERTSGWEVPLRALALTALALLAAGAGVAGLLWASGSGGSGAPTRVASAPTVIASPTAHLTPAPKPVQAEPTLHGALPNFSAGANHKAATPSKASPAQHSGGNPPPSSEAVVNSTSEVARSGTAGATASSEQTAAVQSPGPAALAVAHKFTSAFVLYEIGRENPSVAKTFSATATPRLAHKLLNQPPRLPADGKVPKAKVLNIVAGPRHGDTYTLSASLLRVGVTSELRLTVERSTDGKWLVANILG